ncbi:MULTISPECIES: hypothetical protein [Oceanibaculum]|uniref:Uncharacterized protein n=2 Tax=Oceanibaculum indicum TaxID=526216 RepID=K2JFK3_9PROT|nr:MULTISPECIES: hypothetical protein [Oceanibaculum]EKE69429.1 hypothetical protein P24_16582 [Oceanibaculum indicum P24]MCH2394134.1 hypothetical protein [Oceanibaculum sp.]RKQ69903.1 hypothetical protein BCL74_1837 [Oceanibaculum indicum]
MVEVNILRDVGEIIGAGLAWIADTVLGALDSLGAIFSDFFGGVASGAGMDDASLFAWVLLALGALFIVGALQAFIGARIVGGIFQLVIGAALIGWAVT